tara:strand:- start:340 stop:528 length:189 start_codon:yes stop_codon:yes gene_type:complete
VHIGSCDCLHEIAATVASNMPEESLEDISPINSLIDLILPVPTPLATPPASQYAPETMPPTK